MRDYIKTIIFIIIIQFTNPIKAEQISNVDNYLNYINYDWWYNFNDDNLGRYILKGILRNNDLKILNLKIQEYENFVKYTFGQELPTLSASAMYLDMKDVPINKNMTIDTDGVMLPLTMSYELDLFGKNRLKTKATKKQLEIYNYQLKNAYISFVASLSTLYFNISRLNEILSLYDELILIKNNILDSELISYKNGLSKQNKINDLKQDLNNIKNEKIKILKNRDNLLTQFTIMLGETPANAKNIKITSFNKINFIGNMCSPISSDIIFVRPDVIIAEKELEKAKIDIQVARREFLPTFNISGSLVFNNMASGGFFSASNTIKSLIGSVGQSLFVGGRKKFNLKMKQAKYEQLLENYKKVTLQAIKEINDSLVNIIYDESINVMTYKNMFAENNNYNDFLIQYRNNLISYTDLLKIKQKLIKNKIDLVNSRTENYLDYISLYKATAGQINNL